MKKYATPTFDERQARVNGKFNLCGMRSSQSLIWTFWSVN